LEKIEQTFSVYIKYPKKPLTTNKSKMSNVNSFAALSEDFVAPKAPAKYVPPAQRKAMPKVDEPLNLTSAVQFPTLGGSTTKSSWSGEKSFKEKIDDLIAFEQLSEIEKQERLEEAKKMEGFSVLKLPTTSEHLREICERINEAVSEPEHPEALYMSMLNPPHYMPIGTTVAPLTKSKLHVVEETDFSDEEDYEEDSIHRMNREWTVDCA